MTDSIPFSKCLRSVGQTQKAISAAFRKTKGSVNCFNHPELLTLLLALRIAVNSNCLIKEIEPHLPNDPQLRYGQVGMAVLCLRRSVNAAQSCLIS